MRPLILITTVINQLSCDLFRIIPHHPQTTCVYMYACCNNHWFFNIQYYLIHVYKCTPSSFYSHVRSHRCNHLTCSNTKCSRILGLLHVFLTTVGIWLSWIILQLVDVLVHSLLIKILTQQPVHSSWFHSRKLHCVIHSGIKYMYPGIPHMLCTYPCNHSIHTVMLDPPTVYTDR